MISGRLNIDLSDQVIMVQCNTVCVCTGFRVTVGTNMMISNSDENGMKCNGRG